jgi:ATP-dependent Lon protease
MEASGLTGDDLVVPDETVSAVIADCTCEAGLCNLERELGAICRKVAVTWSGISTARALTPCFYPGAVVSCG